jgi:carbon monoxide dehydrogenase subunit G
MCNHQYDIKNVKYLGIKEKQCKYSTMYDTLRKQNLSNEIDLTLPIDENGECIFHSKNIEWKRANNFTKRFEDLIKLYAILEERSYDFVEFVFIGNEKNITELKNIENQLKTGSFSFVGATFETNVRIENINTIKHNISFGNSRFRGNFIINNCAFSFFHLEAIKVEGFFSLKNTEIDGIADFSHSDFLQLAYFEKINFNHDVFFYDTLFSYKTLAEKDEPITTFKDITFFNKVEFKKAEFDCGVEFPNTIFYYQAEFLDVLFSNEFVADFSDINVNQTLLLSGTTDKRLFDFSVAFRIDETKILGKIIFQYVNFSNIYPKHRDNLQLLTYKGKVEIGVGCIKYRFQTDIKEIVVNERNQNLIEDITRTFKSFFAVCNGKNLGIEIVSKTDDKISFFYFTDENFTNQDAFIEALGKTEYAFWSFLQNAEQVKNHISAATKNEKTDLTKLTDIIIDIGSIFNKIGTRIYLLESEDEDITHALTQAINFIENGSIDFNNFQKLIKIISEQSITGTKNPVLIDATNNTIIININQQNADNIYNIEEIINANFKK